MVFKPHHCVTEKNCWLKNEMLADRIYPTSPLDLQAFSLQVAPESTKCNGLDICLHKQRILKPGQVLKAVSMNLPKQSTFAKESTRKRRGRHKHLLKLPTLQTGQDIGGYSAHISCQPDTRKSGSTRMPAKFQYV